MIDIAAMQGGDAFAINITTKILSGGSADSVIYQTYSGAPTGNGDQVVASAPIFSDQSIAFVVNQTAGTGRSFPWKIVQF